MEKLELLCSTQRALLGLVTPNLRAVYTYHKDNKIHLDFYFDLPPSQNDGECASYTYTNLISDFPDKCFDSKIITIPYPQKIPANDFCAYKRYEEAHSMSPT
jgi:hypothetical protein